MRVEAIDPRAPSPATEAAFRVYFRSPTADSIISWDAAYELTDSDLQQTIAWTQVQGAGYHGYDIAAVTATSPIEAGSQPDLVWLLHVDGEERIVQQRTAHLRRRPDSIAALPVRNSALHSMTAGTFMWVQIITFVIDPRHDDHTLIHDMIASPGYEHDFASPYPDSPVADTAEIPAVHGPWYLGAITTDRFLPTAFAQARDTLTGWALDQDWTEPDEFPIEQTKQLLEPVLTILQAGTIYELTNPDDDVRHPYGWVIGGLGFHEWAVINRTDSTLTLIVTSDD